MLIVLGFVVATLFALVIGRMAWKLALRLGAKRAMRNVPSTVAELQTDRDRLRADHAMMASKLDFHVNDMKMRSAEQDAEVSRHRNRFEIFSQEAVKRDAEILELRKSVTVLESDKLENLEKIGFLTSSLAAKKLEISALQNDLSTRPPAILAEDAPSQDRLQNRITEFTSLSAQMSKQREGIGGEVTKFSNGVFVKPAGSTVFKSELTAENDTAAEKAAAQMQNELKRLDEAWLEKNPEAPLDPIPKQPARRGITNVISLAQRIKALQKTIVN